MGDIPTFEVFKSGHGRAIVDKRCWSQYKRRGFEPVDEEKMRLALSGKFVPEEESEEAADLKADDEDTANTPSIDVNIDYGADSEAVEAVEPEEEGEKSRKVELLETLKEIRTNAQLNEFCDDNDIDIDLASIDGLKKGRIPAVAKYVADNF